MKLRKLTLKEIDDVLETEYIKNFPAQERRNRNQILKMAKANYYECLGTFEENFMLSFMFVAKIEKFVLLDYFAVCGDKKGKGVGGEALKLLKQHFEDYVILGEIESTDCACENSLQREKRKNFYKKNDFEVTDVKVKFFGIDMNIISYHAENVSDKEIENKMTNFYDLLYSKNEKVNNISFIKSNEDLEKRRD